VALALNVLIAVGSALLVLLTARELFPRRPWAWVASLGFLVFLPVFVKTTAMIHPEQLSLLFSAAGLYLVTRMLARRELSPAFAVALGVALGLGMESRRSTLFTIGAVF